MSSFAIPQFLTKSRSRNLLSSPQLLHNHWPAFTGNQVAAPTLPSSLRTWASLTPRSLLVSPQPGQELYGQYRLLKKMQDQVIAVIPAYPSCAGRVNSTLPDAWWLRLDRGETLHSPCQGTKTKHFQVPWDQQRNDKNILIGRSHSSINPVLSRQWMQIHKTSHFICPGAQRIIRLMIFPDVTLISYYLII